MEAKGPPAQSAHSLITVLTVNPDIGNLRTMIPEHVQRILEKYELKALQFEEGSTPTAHTAAEKIGVEVGQIAKSMLFSGKDGSYCLVVCAGDRKVSSSKLKRLTGIKMSMASGAETEKATGFKPGGVCPFGIPEGIPVYLDESLEQYAVVYPAAGTDSTGVPVTPEQLAYITGGSVCNVTQELS